MAPVDDAPREAMPLDPDGAEVVVGVEVSVAVAARREVAPQLVLEAVLHVDAVVDDETDDAAAGARGQMRGDEEAGAEDGVRLVGNAVTDTDARSLALVVELRMRTSHWRA